MNASVLTAVQVFADNGEVSSKYENTPCFGFIELRANLFDVYVLTTYTRTN